MEPMEIKAKYRPRPLHGSSQEWSLLVGDHVEEAIMDLLDELLEPRSDRLEIAAEHLLIEIRHLAASRRKVPRFQVA